MICPLASIRYPLLITHHSTHDSIPNPACDCSIIITIDIFIFIFIIIVNMIITIISFEYSAAELTRIASALCMQLGFLADHPSAAQENSAPLQAVHT